MNIVTDQPVDIDPEKIPEIDTYEEFCEFLDGTLHFFEASKCREVRMEEKNFGGEAVWLHGGWVIHTFNREEHEL